MCNSFTEQPDDGPLPGEAAYVCPACGEEIVVPIDASAGRSQRYVEDCPVCCSPNVLTVHLHDDGDAWVAAEPE